jgi:p-hydroxybenzoate 3-monooxygenase
MSGVGSARDLNVPPRTQVAIIGAGPAGLVLAHLLHLQGIDSVILESHSREHCEQRIRAGFLEEGSASLLESIGLGDRLRREGLVHRAFVFRLLGEDHRIALGDLTDGRGMTIYGQEELVKDLIAARRATGRPLAFQTPVQACSQIDGHEPVVVYRHNDEVWELRCDVIAGCDGFHGPSRAAVKPTAYTRQCPIAWLGVLAAVPPTIEEIVYAWHNRGFALHSVRSPQLSRLHLQCAPDEDLNQWSDERIWDELDARLSRRDGVTLDRGPILQKAVIPLRSFVAEPMGRGRLLLAGDAAHIVPPTGAKGLNLAIADVHALSQTLGRWYARRDDALLEDYSRRRLRHVWQVERFSAWMTSVLHRFPQHDDFDRKLQVAELRHVCSSPSAARALAESYVGLDSSRDLPAEHQLVAVD